ncbi:hypothetical protein PYW08_015268 [Mythimna loreyi]|uniref:Uncharacterized protein n=1 Tax=Mythimna loreyi TaxID=667449 RepID=A0ACC2QVP8_9NEOP|nr:hypothetical protein PYW08_015268 [Mythimna loreyi]
MDTTQPAVPVEPPAYRPPEPPQIMRPTNQRYTDGQPTLIPRGEPILDKNGQPMQIQHGTILEPRGRDRHMNPPIIPVVVGYQMGPEPASTTCSYCQKQMVTRTEGKTTMKTHLMAVFFGMLCLWPCVFLTYHMDTFRNTDHYCPNCNAYIGSYVR